MTNPAALLRRLELIVMQDIKYTQDILDEAMQKYNKGDRVVSPMTGKIFNVEQIKGTWHQTYIKGMDGQFIFDVVWFKGIWAGFSA